jgi:hypothetical protein
MGGGDGAMETERCKKHGMLMSVNVQACFNVQERTEGL